MNFKPMLLSNEEVDINTLQYPIMASPKYDGVRVEVTRKGLFGRSLKPLPNLKLKTYFKDLCDKLPEGVTLEGELYHYGKPCREIAGIANSSKKETDLKGFVLLLFDYYDGDMDLMWMARQAFLELFTDDEKVFIIPHQDIHNKKELLDLYDLTIDKGYEGLVLNNPKAFYKQGRVSNKMNIAYKLKPVRTDDLEIVGVLERMENTNESEINELGYKFKRNTVDAKQPTGIAASLVCLLPNGDKTKVTLTGTEDDRREIWHNRKYYIGKYAEVKSMDYGVKDKPRFPRLIRIKEALEK